MESKSLIKAEESVEINDQDNPQLFYQEQKPTNEESQVEMSNVNETILPQSQNAFGNQIIPENQTRDESIFEDLDHQDNEKDRLGKKIKPIKNFQKAVDHQHNKLNSETKNHNKAQGTKQNDNSVNFDKINEEILELGPIYYQHMYHIKNLQNIECLNGKAKSLELKYIDQNGNEQSLDKTMKVTDMFPVIKYGKVFSVLSIKGIQDDENHMH